MHPTPTLKYQGLHAILTATLAQARQDAAPSLHPAFLAHHQASFQRWKAMPLPTHKSESYRYTPLATAFARAFQHLTYQAVPHPTSTISPFPAHCLTFGASAHPLGTLPEGVQWLPLPQALQHHQELHHLVEQTVYQPSDDAFVTFNQAWPTTTMVLYIIPGTHLEKPLYLRHLGSSTADTTTTQARFLIVAGAGSTATFVEHFYTTAPTLDHWHNSVAHLALQEGATFHHHTLHPLATPAWQTRYTHIQQAAASNYHHHSLMLGGRMVRHHLQASLQGKETSATFHGFYAPCMRNYHEHSLDVTHAVANTHSTQCYRGVVDKASKATFRGKITIPPHSQECTAHQQHDSWHLHPKATSHVRPELAIEADDVTCTHGTTTSPPPTAQLRYMNSRGIPTSHALALLKHGFAADTLARVATPTVKNYLTTLLRQALEEDGTPKNII